MKESRERSSRLFLIWAVLFCLMFSINAADQPMADRILVEKAKHTLTLFYKGKMLKTYRVALGPNSVGHKEKEGDGRTPEGIYKIDWRNPQSKYHLSLHISYPNDADVSNARKMGVSPGGDIMIHGLPNGMKAVGAAHCLVDWTIGCVAVTNTEIEEIWKLVPDGTSIEIRP